MSGRFLRALSCPARIIAAVSPLIPLIAGLVALAAGVLVLRTYGPRYRVGRLLAATPDVTDRRGPRAGAGRAALRHGQRADRRRDEFEDDAHRPLVFRRTRLQLRGGRGLDLVPGRPRERVPFEVRDGLDGIAVDDAALDAGLVVVPRESVGTAADVADRVPPGTPPDDAGPPACRPGLVGRARDRPRRPRARRDGIAAACRPGSAGR